MRFGIVGAGVIGSIHARLISAIAQERPGQAQLVAVTDISAASASRLASDHDCLALASVDDLLARDDVDAVSICLPSGLHAKAAVAALEAGKHVIIEKPIDITLAAADEIIAAERRSGRTVAVISQRRFQPGFRFLHDAAAGGRLGRVTTGIAESTFWRAQSYYDADDWRGTQALDGGGALMNQGIHILDLLTWVMGEPVEVSAYSAVLAHERIEVEDTLTASIRFVSGALGALTATTGTYPDRPVRLTVAGDAGTAVVADEKLSYLETRDGDSAAVGGGDAVRAAAAPLHIDDAHRAQYLDFLAAVRDNRPPLVTTADGRRALALVLAIYESARNGGRPVPVPAGRGPVSAG
ncbi:MAG TPA: Gfo/Idh/MocA family oxidoreductase [Trebonia sp.]|jgi:predicted dehydrogenase|nr:Gfo/Idh/MocA family oxidoreductase [Trebonia sp.]